MSSYDFHVWDYWRTIKKQKGWLVTEPPDRKKNWNIIIKMGTFFAAGWPTNHLESSFFKRQPVKIKCIQLQKYVAVCLFGVCLKN